MTEPHDTPEDFDLKSKSQLKREVEALQALGRQLTELAPEQLAQVPLDETLDGAIREYQRLKKNEARRRQLQYIGRLMRTVEEAELAQIQQAMHRFDASQAEHTRHFHQLERWRDRLLTEPAALTAFLSEHPDADAQHLRQLIRNAQKEQQQGKTSTSARKLFRYLRELEESA